MRRFPLRTIIVIKRGEENLIRRLTPSEALTEFIPQTYFPSTEIMDGSERPVPRGSVASHPAFSLKLKSMELMAALINQLPIYELHCTISQEAVDLTHQALLDSIK